jgi:ABC-type antimicrobial peptide transport system permease subunit
MREISIRIAVGAQRSDIVRMILRKGLSLSLTGLALGHIGAVIRMGFVEFVRFVEVR